jgi:hypothetical protein
LAAGAAAWAAAQEPAQEAGEGLRLFREVVAPALAQNCAECHHPGNRKGDLDLTTREELVFGGESGDPLAGEDPLLLRLVEHREKPFMPKKKPALDAAVVGGIRRWIELGAPYEGTIPVAPIAWWSFGPLRAAAPPADGHPVDAFVRAELGKIDWELAPEADRRVLIRRLWHDLLGLAPTREEVEAFVADARPDAWERLVETALASPRYGERWGRHWLDAARYADSAGYEFDVERPNTWPYRDFVIEAHNRDLPWDEFLRWQLAGDELTPDRVEATAATGFLAAGPRVDNQVLEDLRYDELDDMVATTGSAMLGVTLGCARCHDHKYDPFSAREYYQLVAAFQGTEFWDAPLAGAEERGAADLMAGARRMPWRYSFTEPSAGWIADDFDDSGWETGPGGFGTAGTPGAEVGTEWSSDAIWLRREFAWEAAEPLALWLHHDEDVAVWLNGELVYEASGYLTEYALIELPEAKPRDGGNLLAVRCRQTVGGQYVSVIPTTRERVESARRKLSTVLAVRDRGPEPPEAWLLDRGSPAMKSELLEYGFPAAIGLARGDAAAWEDAARERVDAGKSSGRRSALALWLTDVEDGAGALAARVAVNRVWQHHFGRGLVVTAGDFGVQGDPPSHPELLEWLAAEFVRSGWSLKAIHRLILTSAAWQQGDDSDPRKLAEDPDNRLLARMPARRLEGEILRDRMLQASGCLNLEAGGPAVMPWIHPDAIATGSTRKWHEDVVDGPATWRRSVYVFIRRSVMFPLFEVFDGPNAQQACARRNLTTTPLQALALLNNEFTRDQARRCATRLEAEEPGDRAAQVERAFWLTVQRAPTSAERAEAAAFLRTSPLADFVQVLFGLSEFAYVD